MIHGTYVTIIEKKKKQQRLGFSRTVIALSGDWMQSKVAPPPIPPVELRQPEPW